MNRRQNKEIKTTTLGREKKNGKPRKSIGKPGAPEKKNLSSKSWSGGSKVKKLRLDLIDESSLLERKGGEERKESWG